jgi:hypothetical protein
MDEKTVIIVVVALFIGFLVFFISRSGENYGMLKPSADVTAAFESHRPAADLDGLAAVLSPRSLCHSGAWLGSTNTTFWA